MIFKVLLQVLQSFNWFLLQLVLFNKEDLAHLTPAEKKYFTDLELESAEAVVWGCANEARSVNSMLPELIEQVVKITRRWRSERGTIECLISGIRAGFFLKKSLYLKSFFRDYL